MSYFLTDQKILENSIIKLSGEEVRHVLLARRMKKGERFNLQGVDEKRYVVEIKEIGRNELKLEVVEKVKTPAEPEVKITLFQSYVNEKALDFVFQKSTELGAYKIVLFNSQNTATKLSADQFSSKSVRWNKILWEAAKQSDRIHPPALEYLKSLEDVKKAVVGGRAGKKVGGNVTMFGVDGVLASMQGIEVGIIPQGLNDNNEATELQVYLSKNGKQIKPAEIGADKWKLSPGFENIVTPARTDQKGTMIFTAKPVFK
jgi:hypothetical protein